MSPTLTRRQPLTAWMLYFSILFGVLACGIGHGQMAGLQLSGLDGAFCATDSPSKTGIDLGTKQLGNQLPGGLSCPLCATIALGVAVLLGLFWPRLAAAIPRLRRELRCKAPPRYSWPSANPRASPF